MKDLWNELKGYKTYFFAALLLAVGVYLRSSDLIVMACGLAGLRHGLTTEIKKVVLSNDPIKTAKEEAPKVLEEVVQNS